MEPPTSFTVLDRLRKKGKDSRRKLEGASQGGSPRLQKCKAYEFNDDERLVEMLGFRQGLVPRVQSECRHSSQIQDDVKVVSTGYPEG